MFNPDYRKAINYIGPPTTWVSRPPLTQLKDHEVAELVNELTEIAVKYGQTQQLRQRISSLINQHRICKETKKCQNR